MSKLQEQIIKTQLTLQYFGKATNKLDTYLLACHKPKGYTDRAYLHYLLIHCEKAVKQAQVVEYKYAGSTTYSCLYCKSPSKPFEARFTRHELNCILRPIYKLFRPYPDNHVWLPTLENEIGPLDFLKSKPYPQDLKHYKYFEEW